MSLYSDSKIGYSKNKNNCRIDVYEILKILEQKFEMIHISKFKLKRHVLSSSKSI